jgi:hypothetical protein
VCVCACACACMWHDGVEEGRETGGGGEEEEEEERGVTDQIKTDTGKMMKNAMK